MFPKRFRKILAGIEKISIMKNRYSIFRYHRPILAILHRNLSFSHFGIDIDFWYRYPVSIPNGPPRSIGGPPCQVWSSWVMNWLQGETSNTKKNGPVRVFSGYRYHKNIEFGYRYHMDHPGPSMDHHAKFGPHGPSTNLRVRHQPRPLPTAPRDWVRRNLFLTKEYSRDTSFQRHPSPICKRVQARVRWRAGGEKHSKIPLSAR